MDLGSMTKKLKNLQYKSKMEFVADLNLIWDNCLRYNSEMTHPLRRLANAMRREAEKLIPLIPDLVIRSRAEVEAEERRKHNGGEDDGGEDSDDEPIMSSRGRKAGGAKGSTKSRKTHTEVKEGTPSLDQKPVLQLNGLLAKAHRESSEAVEGSNGFATPPIGGGSITPSGLNGISGMGSNADLMDVDGPSLNGMALGQALHEAVEQQYEDDEYMVWKQFTKKDRALIARENFKLFNETKLNIDEPALLRNKAKMRRFARSSRQAESSGLRQSAAAHAGASANATGETLAENIDGGEDYMIPDYYEPLGTIPDIQSNMQWIEDDEGQVINTQEEFIRLVPLGQFIAPKGALTARVDANIKQMQDTRKLCHRISMVKQMQIQTQVSNDPYLYPNTAQLANCAVGLCQPVFQVRPGAIYRGRHRAYLHHRRWPNHRP